MPILKQYSLLPCIGRRGTENANFLLVSCFFRFLTVSFTHLNVSSMNPMDVGSSISRSERSFADFIAAMFELSSLDLRTGRKTSLDMYVVDRSQKGFSSWVIGILFPLPLSTLSVKYDSTSFLLYIGYRVLIMNEIKETERNS